jgi:hypothetical protein
MNRVQLLKLAYARGAYLALQEAGYNEKVAEDLAYKIAERDALDVLEDVGIGAGVGGLGGAALGAGAGALYNPMARAFGGGRGQQNLTTLLEGSGGEFMPGKNPRLQRLLAEMTGGVPGASLSGKFTGPGVGAATEAPSRLLDLIHSNPTAGNVNFGTRAGFGAGMGIGGLTGGLAGE